jgi:hypothetical protein
MNPRIINWGKVDLLSPEGSMLAVKAINKFFNTKTTEHFTMRADFPADGLPSLEQIRRQVEADNGWQAAFKVIDFTGGNGAGGDSGFDVATAGSGLVLKEVQDGMKALVYTASGNSVRVPFVRYEGALLQIQTLIEDGRWWDLEDIMLEAYNAHNTALASTHYALFDGVGVGSNLAWQAPTPAALPATDADYVNYRDANTINKACIDIVRGADSWMGINAATAFVATCPLEVAQRVSQAIAADKYGVSKVGFNVSVVSTAYLTGTNYYISPVGKSGRSGIRKNFEIEWDKDILANASTMAVRGRWGAIAFDNLIRRCATA